MSGIGTIGNGEQMLDRGDLGLCPRRHFNEQRRQSISGVLSLENEDVPLKIGSPHLFPCQRGSSD